MLCMVALEDGDWVVKARVKVTCESAMVRSRMRPNETMSRFCSGSLTARSASRTACSVTIPGLYLAPRGRARNPCTLVLHLLQKAGDFRRRFPPNPEPFRLRCHRHHDLRPGRPPDGADGERLHLGVARSPAHPGVRRQQGAELSRA